MMHTADLLRLLDEVVQLSRHAGAAILDVYTDESSFDTHAKADGSPLTRADLASHEILVHGLSSLRPSLPVLSEESPDEAFARRRTWPSSWLVDPLDGTKEFVKRNGEFTVNVALIEVQGGVGVPVAGVVHVPVTGVTYLGAPGHGAWRDAGGTRTAIRTATAPLEGPVQIVASRSHGSPDTDRFVGDLEERFGRVERATSGSSLKLCRVAEGAAHYYPRVGPTSEWDTAAAHAIVVAAGGCVWTYGTRDDLTYAKADVLNPPFLVACRPDVYLPRAYGSGR